MLASWFRVLVLTLLLFVGGCGVSMKGCNLLPEPDNRVQQVELIKHLRRNVVFVFSDNPTVSGYQQGSAVLLETEGPYYLVLTAWHVLYHETEQRASGISLPTKVMLSDVREDERSWINAVESELLCFDAQWDLAALLVRKDWIAQRFEGNPENLGVPLYAGNLPVGSKVWIVGNVASHPQAVSDGIVSTYDVGCKPGSFCRHPRYMISTASAYYGASGGGIFDRDGTLRGVVNRVGRAGLRYSFSTGAEDTADFLSRCAKEALWPEGNGYYRAVEVTRRPNDDTFILGSPSNNIPEPDTLEVTEEEALEDLEESLTEEDRKELDRHMQQLFKQLFETIDE